MFTVIISIITISLAFSASGYYYFMRNYPAFAWSLSTGIWVLLYLMEAMK